MEVAAEDGFDDMDDDLFRSIQLDQHTVSHCNTSAPESIDTNVHTVLNPRDVNVISNTTKENDSKRNKSKESVNENDEELRFGLQHQEKPIQERSVSRQTHDQEPGVGRLSVPESFPFPFEPYDIQVGFMKNLYQALDGGKIGIFESPTGTGKSLSLICGALRWLKDFEKKQREELDSLLQEETTKREEGKAEELDWITAFVKKKEDDEKSKKLKEERDLMLNRETRMKQLRGKLKPRHRVKRKRDQLEEQFDDLFQAANEDLKSKYQADMAAILSTGAPPGEEGEEHLVCEYVSDEEMGGEENKQETDEEEQHITKIYYCSRTHSQIAQFVREVMKSPYGPDTRVVSLGSRQNLCINDSVRRLSHLSLINDRCLEMQKNKSAKKQTDEDQPKKRRKTGGSCPFYKQDPMLDLRDSILVNIRDIEQLTNLGRELKACPYYGSRYAIPAAEIVALPYNTLLHKSTRESCGIQLKDNIVIIDEAHNLVDTITSVYSAQVSGSQVTCAHSQLSQYVKRYEKRLKAKNLMYIRQLLFILASLVKCLGGQTGLPAEEQKLNKTDTSLKTINDFLFETQLDNLNLFKILRYCEKSQIAKKLHGFVEQYQVTSIVKAVETNEEKSSSSGLTSFLKQLSSGKTQQNAEESAQMQEQEKPGSGVSLSSPLMQITAFLQALTNADKDGRIVIAKQDLLSASYLKFLLLNPAVHFEEIVQSARSVIVAGGTMQPLAEFKNQLFFAAGVSPDRVWEYSCGHVIDKEHLLPVALARGPSGHVLDFTYQHRSKPETLDELGRVVHNVCNVVPGGVVVFFPSYEYEKLVHAHWQKHAFLEKIAAKKRIFREPKKSNQVESVLEEYASCIKKHLTNKYSALTGAVLFCVVGGKMSEGINFSDDLGRCIIMVGLPYPNIKSPELKEKMDYLNANMPKSADGRLPGQVHYENLCMKAVNQSIGRAIRHKEDYASMLLVDQRYLRPSMSSKLPAWISSSLQNIDRFGPAFAQLRKFYANKQTSS